MFICHCASTFPSPAARPVKSASMSWSARVLQSITFPKGVGSTGLIEVKKPIVDIVVFDILIILVYHRLFD